MVPIKTLLPDLRNLITELAEDLLVRSSSDAKIDAGLRNAFRQIESGGRTAQAFEVWREDYLDQVAVAWVLACVFVRFMEDNHLIDECWLAGEGERRKLAEDTHELFFREHPHDTDREYFHHVFKEVGKIPAAKDLFAEGKTPLWAVAPSGDAAMHLLKFWREIDAETGRLRREFSVFGFPFSDRTGDPEHRAPHTENQSSLTENRTPKTEHRKPKTENLDTRFLGDLYQELSERAKKKFALLQTPVFVEEFILDRTLTPALDEFGLEKVRMIDPTCGSGHFLLGGFARLFDLWCQRESNEILAAQKALDGVWGVDINPFAVAIARFRLIVAAVQACGIKRLKQAPGWNLHLAIGDSLLFGSKPSFDGQRTRLAQQLTLFEVSGIYATEDRNALQEILGQGYHVVVGNPPYIIVRDRAQNSAYRQLYSTCHQKYSLGVPFTQRFWELAMQPGESNGGCGYIGLITANSFMKREFGKKLIEEFFPRVDLTHVIDTSGAYIPGHGTPTVILFGRARKPVCDSVRAVLGIKGEPVTPEDPTQGHVWRSIVKCIDIAGAKDDYTSTSDVARTTFGAHPWTIGGGGASELKEQLDETAAQVLGDLAESIGITSVTGEDDAFVVPRRQDAERLGTQRSISLMLGDVIRDHGAGNPATALWPYDSRFGLLAEQQIPDLIRLLWPCKMVISERRRFGTPMLLKGAKWYEWQELYHDKLHTPFSIVFSFIASHNHFVLDRGGKVFNRSAPIIKLPPDATEDDHLALLGLLNSSTGLFWMLQIFQSKGDGERGSESERWFRSYEFTGTGLRRFPVPEAKPLALSRRLNEIARKLGDQAADQIVDRWSTEQDLKTLICDAESKAGRLRGQMIALQEELDWHCYQLYGLLSGDLRHTGDDLPEVAFGQRAFEIVMARQMAKGELATAWFERQGSTPITEIPTHWPAAYRKLVERRIKAIETNKEIALIEKPEYKRRWNSERWAEQEERALKHWLLDQLESPKYRNGSKEHPELTTTAQMADVASADGEFLQVATLYRGRLDFDVAALLAELVEGESVPFLPILRYKPAGLRKREVWERTWDLQRQQDSGKDVGEIPVPPKYATADFLKNDFWRLRGKLDVPKERWISYPHCSTDGDPTLVVGWAGWNHLEQATALVAYYDARKREG